jgi:hypothetical protein
MIELAPARTVRRATTLALLSFSIAALAACGSSNNQSSSGSGGSGTGATGGSGGSGGSGGGAAETQGCSASVKLLATPDDASARGPWPVGAKTVKLDTLTAEVWYPAEIGSDKDKPPVTYDLRQWLPDSEMGKIPDDAAPSQECGCHAGLPLDTAHGPYPVVIFIHGTAGFRTQSLAHMEHWASRGFVVVAADHPGLYLADALSLNLKNDLPGDVKKMMAALVAPAGDIDFLKDHIDMTHVGISGHSAGGMALKTLGGEMGVRVLIPLAAGGTDPTPTLESTLVMGGKLDKVVSYDKQQAGYDASAPIKRLVGVSNTGHLFPTDLCWMRNKAGQDIVTVAQMYMIKNSQFASALFDCPDGQLAQDKARAIVNYATAAALEEKLACKAGNPFDGFQAKFPDVAEFKEALK